MDLKNIKVSNTAYRVLYILSLLNQEKYSINDLLEKLSNNKEIARSFSKDVILKYLTTLKYSGFKIEKTRSNLNALYSLKKAPFVISLTDEDIKSVSYVYEYLKNLHQASLFKNYKSFIQKITKYLDDDNVIKLENYLKNSNYTFKYNYKNYKEELEKLESFCLAGQTVLLVYKNYNKEDQRVSLEPTQIEYKNGKVYFCGNTSYDLKYFKLLLDDIVEIKQLPSKSPRTIKSTKIIFKLSGRLFNTYRLYNNESIIELNKKTQESLISCEAQDIDKVLCRLMRYGNFCEVISPTYVRSKMIDKINNSLERYNENIAV